MSKQWDEDEFDGNGEENEFWKDFEENQEGTGMLEVNRQMEFDVTHKQLNIDILDKCIQIAKGRKFWWWFASNKKKTIEIKRIYRNMLKIIEETI